jgi:hypothetical protein
MAGSSYVDYGIVTPLTSSTYQTGFFKAEGGLGTGDWSWNSWPGQPGDVYFKELGTSKVNVVLGSTTDQINNNSSNQMVLAGLNGVGLNSDTQFLKSGWPRGGMNGPTGALNSISSGTILAEQINTDAIYLEHFTIPVTAFACSVNPTFTVEDCGTTAACSSPTADASASPSAVGSAAYDSSISTHTIAAGHYLAIELTGGTCTALNANPTLEWAGN